MRIGIADLVSSSNFPVIAADVLGFYRDEGLDVSVTPISPIEKCVEALHEGEVDFVAGPAHAPLLAFPDWRGAKVICAQAHGTDWFLAMRRDLRLARGELFGLKGQRIAAPPLAAAALRRVLIAAGVDPHREKIEIGIPEWARQPGNHICNAAVQAFAEGQIDGFFGDGIVAEMAAQNGAGDIVLDLRRGDGPAECFNYTMPAVATTDRRIGTDPVSVAGVVRAIVRAQTELGRDIACAHEAAGRLFAPEEAGLVVALVLRDVPFYSAALSYASVNAMNGFARDIGLLRTQVSYQTVAASQFAGLWEM